jgi:hypothetical protein
MTMSMGSYADALAAPPTQQPARSPDKGGVHCRPDPTCLGNDRASAAGRADGYFVAARHHGAAAHLCPGGGRGVPTLLWFSRCFAF